MLAETLKETMLDILYNIEYPILCMWQKHCCMQNYACAHELNNCSIDKGILIVFDL